MAKPSTHSQRTTRAVSGSPSMTRLDMTCRQCPEHPLRRHCKHTAEGRQYLVQSETNVEEELGTVRQGRKCTRCPGKPLRARCIHTKAGLQYLREKEIQLDILSMSGSPSLIPSVHQEQRVVEHQYPAPLAPVRPTSPFVLQVPSISAFPPLPVSISSPIPSVSAELPRHVQSSLQDVHGALTDNVPLETDRVTQKARPKRATKSNPYHGIVTGCMRGAEIHNIVRGHACPKPLDKSKNASKAFLESVNQLIVKADDISAKTGCWMFLGAQHTGGVGSTVHYASPRLLRDAPQQMHSIANNFNMLISDLLASRRDDAVKLSTELRQQKEENRDISACVNSLEHTLIEKEALLNMYKEKLGMLKST